VKRAVYGLILGGMLLTTGCGTIGTLMVKPEPYSGTRAVAQACGREPSKCDCGWLFGLDLPFSFALDTVVLPFTIVYDLVSRRDDR
jgi:uncharacterized protein YceK